MSDKNSNGVARLTQVKAAKGGTYPKIHVTALVQMAAPSHDEFAFIAVIVPPIALRVCNVVLTRRSVIKKEQANKSKKVPEPAQQEPQHNIVMLSSST